ncbi:MAG: SagB/ThcOx family dehydrogenase [Nitrospirae bacterium]|nr:SagB/ThcOx family dehydrogenase [Nitrospirota bacterium]
MDSLEIVKQYHEMTKHDFNRYAPALGYMDWANQPNPFRRYEGAAFIQLPILTQDQEPPSPFYESLYAQQSLPSHPLTLPSVSRFLEYALSITAWKVAGENKWALRSNPSSGNLHPTEGYLFLGETLGETLVPGLYHYAPKEHGLEQRMTCSSELAAQLLHAFPPHTILMGLSSIHWREAWKYGERAFRYCQHDIGHALGTVRIAAATLGWKVILLTELTDQTVGSFLGLNRLQDFDQNEPELPELIMAIWPHLDCKPPPISLSLPLETIDSLMEQHWVGSANRLSRDKPIPWEGIDAVTKASWKKTNTSSKDSISYLSPQDTSDSPAPGPLTLDHNQISAHQIIHQRRSALAFDGQTSISASRFFTMLERVMPQAGKPIRERPQPWDILPWSPTIHLAMFVHRVDDLPSGLYLLLRDSTSSKKDMFQSAMHEQFVWDTPTSCPNDLPLYLLEEGNSQKIAMQVSCWQEIGSDSAVALGMIAEFDSTLDEYGPWFYKRFFWEAGLIGQVLYLEAEAAGIQATGIGCFFDDPVHRVLGFPDTRFQSLYHFTIGGAVEDTRLTTLPPYGDHLS